MHGQQVRLGSDYIFCERSHTDTAVQQAIDDVYQCYEAAFKKAELSKPSVFDFQNGALCDTYMAHLFLCSSVHNLINYALEQMGEKFPASHSDTASSILKTDNPKHIFTLSCQRDNY